MNRFELIAGSGMWYNQKECIYLVFSSVFNDNVGKSLLLVRITAVYCVKMRCSE